MKAMNYILKDFSSRISYDDLGNVYIDITSGLSWQEDEFLMYMGFNWHQGDEYIFISKEDYNLYSYFPHQNKPLTLITYGFDLQ